MPIPSLYRSREDARPWRVARVAVYGGVVGALAAALRTLGPLRGHAPVAENVLEIVAAAAGFALLCAGTAALRNYIARRLIRSGTG